MSNSKVNYLLKNVGILTISNFASKILVFLLVPLYTAVLSTSEFGSYDLAISTVSLVYPVLTLNIVDSVMRFLMTSKYPVKSVVSIGFKFSLYGIFLFLIGILFLQRINCWSVMDGLEYCVVLYYVVYTLNQLLIQLAKGLENIKIMGIAGVLSTFVMLISNIIFLLVLRWGVKGFFIANVISQLASLLFLFFTLKMWRYIIEYKVDKVLQKEMLRYSVPLIATVVGWWLNSASDKYVVAFFLGVATNGLLSVAYKVPSIINTLQGIFIQAWQISAIREFGESKTAQFYGKTFAVINLLMTFTASGLIILNRPLARILFAKDFYSSWQLVPFLIISIVINSASGMLGPILAAQMNSKAMMWSALIGAGANVILNIVLVALVGAQGATIATVVCSFLIYEIRKIAVGDSISIDNYRIILISWLLLCMQAFVEIYLGWYYIEIFILFILSILNFAEISNLLCKVKVGAVEIINLRRERREK